jgi:hypothetical protein
MAGNLDSSTAQSLMRIADQISLINKNLETQNALLRKLVEQGEEK